MLISTTRSTVIPKPTKVAKKRKRHDTSKAKGKAKKARYIYRWCLSGFNHWCKKDQAWKPHVFYAALLCALGVNTAIGSEDYRVEMTTNLNVNDELDKETEKWLKDLQE